MEYVEVDKHRYSLSSINVTLLITPMTMTMTKCHEHFNHPDHRSGLHPRTSGNSHTFSTDYHHSLNLIVKPGVDLATAGDVDGQANPTLCARCRGSGELLLKITIMMIILMTMARASWLLPFEERVVILNICQVTRTFPTPIDRWALTEAQSAVEKVFWQHHSSRHLDHHLSSVSMSFSY